ncbi:hypothetical protein Nepgr_016412 [Nepenthes gracilis]|uniref:Uncharacterized protein n=1 Tax=Nepenthes gracilis TaxID=150966 RepID=A0AAD3SQF8_NEPGR|nr:hypothetical protein Nepgr_016412 [Nepenthes gracilis]
MLKPPGWWIIACVIGDKLVLQQHTLLFYDSLLKAMATGIEYIASNVAVDGMVAGSFVVMLLLKQCVDSGLGFCKQTRNHGWRSVKSCTVPSAKGCIVWSFCFNSILLVWAEEFAWEDCYGVPFHAPEADVVPASIIAKACCCYRVMGCFWLSRP